MTCELQALQGAPHRALVHHVGDRDLDIPGPAPPARHTSHANVAVVRFSADHTTGNTAPGGAVAEPSGVDDARQDRPRYSLAERFGGAGIVALKSASLRECTR